MSDQRLAQKITVSSLLRFTFPTIIMMVFTSVYSMVDGIFVSRFVGADAISATNIVYPVIYLVIGLGAMFGSGGSAVIAKKMGEGRLQEACEDLSLLTLVSAITGLLISAAGLAAARPILYALGSNDRLYPYCRDYFITNLSGFPFYMLQLVFQCYFVAAGRPKLGLYSSLLAGVTNAVLDYVFIVHLDLGIGGAGLATVCGYLIPSVTGLVFFARSRSGLCFRRPHLRRQVLTGTMSNGSSEMVTNLANAVIFFVINIVTLRVMGENGLAAISMILYCQFLFTSIYMGFSSGAAPLISYNLGAGNARQLHRIFVICLGFIAVSSVGMTLLPFFTAGYIVRFFTQPGTAVYDMAVHGFLLFALGYLFAGINIFSSSFFTALSNGKISAIISFARTFGLILPSLLILPELIGSDGVWLAIPIAEALCSLLSFWFLRSQRIHYPY